MCREELAKSALDLQHEEKPREKRMTQSVKKIVE